MLISKLFAIVLLLSWLALTGQRFIEALAHGAAEPAPATTQLAQPMALADWFNQR
ncbi:MAG: hypothetical protein KGM60_12680 [Comamonadaceae bacterium]|nr:hypothetical protein [Pseudomonadota bacterium]MBS0610096.1 hypothetical protein [Pseudomonadota bacterium]MDE2415609.1 hypothetical protein [Comamonadaceae bacterium]